MNPPVDAPTSSTSRPVTSIPNSRKAPDALLKLGYAQYELKHVGDARATLNQVVQRYPASDAAKLATERLSHIPADAH